MLASIARATAILSTALVVTACSAFGGKAAPEPEFTAISKEAPFELRSYPELVVVKTAMNDGTRGGFGRLFDYISGANGGKRKIAMTAPVLETEKGTEIAMTAPVLRNQTGAGQEMAFILPKEFTTETAPVPTDPAVILDVIAPRSVAVISFSGVARDDDVAEARRKLEAWIAAKGLTATGPAELAQYNPPWTVPAMRRNEVLIPIKGL